MKIEIVDINDIIQYCKIKGKVTAISPIDLSEPSNPVVTVKIDNRLYTLNKTFLLGLTDKPTSPRFLLYICDNMILIGREARFHITGIYCKVKDVLYVDNQFRKTIEPLKDILIKFEKLKNKFSKIYEEYIYNNNNRVYASFLSTKQMGHHLHNELPGFFNIVKTINLKYVFSYTEIFAKHEELFSENTFIKQLTNEEIFQKICTENITLLKCTLPTIQPSLLSNIKKIKSNENSIKTYNKCILLTIRLAKRILTNQFDFIAENIKFLENLFPGSIFLIDGCVKWYNVDSTEQYWKDSKEQQLVNDLKQTIPHINIHSLIGLDVPTYLNFLHYVDFYIAHCHTPQHKVGYLTNACGLVHGAYNDKPINPRPKEKEIEEHRKTENIFGLGSKAVHYPHNCFTYTSDSSQYPAPIEYTANISECINFIENYLLEIK